MATQVPYYLITGFLGSGKTTLINSLLQQLGTQKVGLLLNDFGNVEIDTELFPVSEVIQRSRTLTGGQIFCACLAGSFVRQVVELVELDVDLILVETSGLAKPSTLMEMAEVIEQKSEQKGRFGGMLCVIDALRFLPLEQVISNVEEQVLYSDLCVINKAELADKEQRSQVESRLHDIAPQVPVITSAKGNLDLSALLRIQNPTPGAPQSKFATWGDYRRPQSAFLAIPVGMERHMLVNFLQEIGPKLLRAKGFVKDLEGTLLRVDVSGEVISLTEHAESISVPLGLQLIYQAGVGFDQQILALWEQHTHQKGDLVEA